MPKLIDETDTSLHILMDDGSTLSPAKNGLSAEAIAQYQALPRADGRAALPPIVATPPPPAQPQMNLSDPLGFNPPPVVEAPPVETESIQAPMQLAPQMPMASAPQQQMAQTTQRTSGTTGLSAEGKAIAALIPGDARATGEAVDGLARAQALGEHLKAQEMVTGVQANEIAANELKMRKQAQDAELDKQMKAYEATVDEAAKFKSKDFFEDNSKITAGIAIMLGALGQGISGRGSNMGLDAVNEAISMHAAKEKAKYEQLRDKSQGAQTTYGMLVTKLGNQEKADAAMYDIGLKIAQQKIDAVAQASKSPVVLAQAEVAKSELMAKAHESMLTTADKVTSQIMQGTNVQTESGKPMDMSLTVPGVGQAYSKEGAATMRKMKADTENVTANVSSLIKMTGENGKSISPTKRAEADIIVKTLIGALRESIAGPGAMSEGDRALLQEVIANPTSIFSSDAVNKAKLMKLNSIMKNKFDSVARNEIQGMQRASPASLGVAPRK